MDMNILWVLFPLFICVDGEDQQRDGKQNPKDNRQNVSCGENNL